MSDKWQFAIQEIDSVTELIGKDLHDWRIEQLTAVHQSDWEGRSSSVVGYFRDETVANAFANPTDKEQRMSTYKAVVLTNGKSAFLIQNEQPLNMFDDEAEAARLRQSIKDKLTVDEQRLLGI